MDTQTSEELFYLIGPDNSRLVPYIAHARDGRKGYQLTPRRYQNSVSAYCHSVDRPSPD